MPTHELSVLCCPISAVNEELLGRYRALLSADELQRLNNYRSPSAANEFLIGRALLRTALSKRLQCAADELRFARDDDGKPFLTSPSANQWQFNLSHSHAWVVVALSNIGAIGIDIEVHGRHNNLTAIAHRYFSASEQRSLDNFSNSPGNEWRRQFFAIWTLKEAHAKALGCGLAKILGSSSIEVDLARQTIAMQLSDIAQPAAPVSSWLYAPDASCSLAVVLHAATAITPVLSRAIPLQQTEDLNAHLSARGLIKSPLTRG